MVIKVIICDLGGVILDVPHVDTKVARWATRLGRDASELNRLLWDEDLVAKANTGALDGEEYWRMASARLGIDPTQMRELLDDWFAGEELNSFLVDFLLKLKPQIRLAALSNAWSTTRPYLKRHNLEEVFEAIVISAEEGWAKPDPKIYEVTLERMGVRPADSVFIDDKMKNVQAAQKMGIHGIHHTSNDQSVSELMRLIEKPSR